MNTGDPFLRHRALSVAHGFGTRAAVEPVALQRPRQVHGRRVVELGSENPAELGEADALIAKHPGVRIGIVTADCVPILVAQGARVAAIHAGWRGLALGVVEATLAALDAVASDEERRRRVAVVGPHICPKHYEIDTPVRTALEERHARVLERVLVPTRPGHWQLDLGMVAQEALVRAGCAAERVHRLSNCCTFADSKRFASRRRDGAGTGRLVHWIEAPRSAPGVSLDTEKPPA